MKKNIKKRTEMVIETHEITIIRANGTQRTAFCEICQSSVAGFSIEQISQILKIDSSEVCRLIETRKFHLAARHRFALVCGNSLKDDVNNSF